MKVYEYLRMLKKNWQELNPEKYDALNFETRARMIEDILTWSGGKTVDSQEGKEVIEWYKNKYLK